MGKKKKREDLADRLIDSLLDEESEIANFSIDNDADVVGMSGTAKVLWSEINDSENVSEGTAEIKTERAVRSVEPQFQAIGAEEKTLAIDASAIRLPLDEISDDSEPVIDEPISSDDKTIGINLDMGTDTLKVGGSLSVDTLGSSENTIAVAVPKGTEGSSVKEAFGFNPGSAMGATPMMGTQEAALVQAENLRIAQSRILELETTVENLRRENEQLAAAGDSLTGRAEELNSEKEKLRNKLEDQRESLEGEISILRDGNAHKEAQNGIIRKKVEELESRLNNDLKKIRIRERELEHRLELVRMENEALSRNKDETILGLKRQQDQLNHETESYRTKMQELYKQLGDNQDRFRRTVRALRLALSNLELADDGNAAIKKVDD